MVSNAFKNVGITLQAYLERTLDDIQALGNYTSGRVRLVKGVYDEEEAMSRSIALNRHYLACIYALVEQGKKVNAATHDIALLDEIEKDAKICGADITFEMLHGITPKHLHRIKAKGFSSAIYIAFGKEWYVHFLHRLAEHPPNILLAAEDICSPQGGNAIQHPYF